MKASSNSVLWALLLGLALLDAQSATAAATAPAPTAAASPVVATAPIKVVGSLTSTVPKTFQMQKPTTLTESRKALPPPVAQVTAAEALILAKLTPPVNLVERPQTVTPLYPLPKAIPASLVPKVH